MGRTLYESFCEGFPVNGSDGSYDCGRADLSQAGDEGPGTPLRFMEDAPFLFEYPDTVRSLSGFDRSPCIYKGPCFSGTERYVRSKRSKLLFCLCLLQAVSEREGEPAASGRSYADCRRDSPLVNLSVVIPVYNGASHLESFLDNLVTCLEKTDHTWEVFLVDDHSGDGTFHTIRKMNGKDSRIRGCRLSENRGQQNAIYCGLLSSRGRYIVTMDDDGQHPLSRLTDLIETLEKGWDAVYMVNRTGKRSGIQRFGTGLTDLFFRLFCGKPAGVEIGSYRIMKRTLVERFEKTPSRFVYISALIFRSMPEAAVCSLRYEPEKSEAMRSSRFSLKRRAGVFLRLFIHYGPFRKLIPFRGEPYTIEDML